jgi:hypothetical protein
MAEADDDRAQLERMRLALNATAVAMKRDDYRLWILRGRPGYT